MTLARRRRGLAAPGTAIAVRDIVEDIAAGAAENKLVVRRAKTILISNDKKIVRLSFIDEPGIEFDVRVLDKLPKAVGQLVDVAVRDGMEFSIWAVIGDTEIVGDVPKTPPGATPATGAGALALASSGGAITATWGIVEEASHYELIYSQTETFDPVHPSTRTQVVNGNSWSLVGLKAGDIWYFQVRAVNVKGPGPWSATVSATVKDFEPSDGIAPTDSPAVTVTPSLHMLSATWAPQPNKDLVTYEVHMSTVSGFVPDATTLLGETVGTFWVTTKTPAGADLVNGTTYFIRLVAKDPDGKAVPGIQGSGAPQFVDLGEAGGLLPSPSLTGDGVVPTAPGTPVVTNGIGYLYLTWPPSSSVDPPTYEVHVSTVAGFAPDANTLSFTTTSRFGFLRKQGPGVSGAPLDYGVTYFIKIRGVDRDGAGPYSPEVSGVTVRTNTADLQVGAIAVGSAIIADLAVDGAKIADAAISTAKIGDLQVATAKIAELGVTNAKIKDLTASKITTDVMQATLTITGRIITSTGTARVEVNSSGFFAYDANGTATVSINTNGSAAFTGNITATTLNVGGANINGNANITGTLSGGTISGSLISGGTVRGAVFQTSAGANRTEVSEGSGNDIRFHNDGNSANGFINGYARTNPWTGVNSGGISIVTAAFSDTAAKFELHGGTTPYFTMNGQLSVSGGGISVGNGHRISGGSVKVGDPNVTGHIDFFTNSILNSYSARIIAHGGNNNNASATINIECASLQWNGTTLATATNHNHSVDHSYAYTGFSYLTDAPLYFRTSGDANHRIEYDQFGGGRDGPDIRGHAHYGIIINSYSSTGYIGRWDSGGLVIKGAYATTSLRETKNDIEPLRNADPAFRDKVKALKPVKYKRADVAHIPGRADKVHFGLVAEEVERVFPELCAYEDDGTLVGLEYGALTVPLLEMVQQLIAEVDQLRTDMNAVKPTP